MKRLLLAGFIGLIGLGFTAADVEARRLGGGISQGMKRQAPPPQKAPDNPPPQQAAPQNPAAAPAAAGTTAAAAVPAKRSWLGPVAGLAAGLGIAALLSHLGLGEAFANFVTLLLLVLVAVFLVRFLMRRLMPGSASANRGMQFAGAQAGAAAGGAAQPMPGGAFGAGDSPAPRGTGWASPGAALTPLSAGAPTAGGAVALPAGFDAAEFERAAKMIFVRLQAANDHGDLEDLRQFSTPEMFAAFRVDLHDRSGTAQKTDVVQLDAEIVDWAQEDGRQIVSVRYHGLIREAENDPAAPFDEVWHLVRPADGSRSWAIAGIQQLANG